MKLILKISHNFLANINILKVLIDIQNSEVGYLDFIKNAFDLYAEPLR